MKNELLNEFKNNVKEIKDCWVEAAHEFVECVKTSEGRKIMAQSMAAVLVLGAFYTGVSYGGFYCMEKLGLGNNEPWKEVASVPLPKVEGDKYAVNNIFFPDKVNKKEVSFITAAKEKVKE